MRVKAINEDRMWLCSHCAYQMSDCKGTKAPDLTHCDYYKKPTVFNVRELAERCARLEKELAETKYQLQKCRDELKAKW